MRPILLIVGVIAAALTGMAGKDTAGPAVKEALEREIHGKLQLKGDRIDVRYDFRDAIQVRDFSRGFQFLLNPEFDGVKKDPIKFEAGKLFLPKGDQIVSTLPLGAIQDVLFVLSGAKEFTIVLGQKEDAIWAQLGEYANLSVGSRGLGGFLNDRVFNLDPKRSYKVELVLERKRVVVRVDGKEILQQPLPKEFGAMERCGFWADSGERPHITGFQIRGTLSADALPMARNRGLAREKRPPQFEPGFAAEAGAFGVLSEVSQEHADRWLRLLDAQRAALLASCAPESPLELPKRTVYAFASRRVLSAYLEGVESRQVLPSGDYCVLAASDQTEAEELGMYSVYITLYYLANDLLGKAYPNASFWWLAGRAAYVSNVDPSTMELKLGRPSPAFGARVRKFVSSGESPRMSDLLAGQNPPQTNYWRAVELAGAWIAFLEQSEGGANRGLLEKCHTALRAGRPAAEVSAEVFPVDVFNELYPKFTTYLEGF